MKKITVLLCFTSLCLFSSCGNTGISYKNNYDKTISKTEKCPDLKIVHNSNYALNEFKIDSIDVLPLFVDTQLNYPDTADWELRESLRAEIQPEIFESLKKSGIVISDYLYGEIFLAEDIMNYRNKIRHFSFGLAHSKTETKTCYPDGIEKYGNQNYKLGFFFQVLPKEMEDRIYIHLLTFDVSKKEIIYYDYLIYKDCIIKDNESFSYISQSMIANFKTRHF